MTLAVIEFVLVSFIAPVVPGAIPVPTATLNLLATPTITLLAPLTEGEGLQATVISTTPEPTNIPGCIPGQIEIISPRNGQEVSGVIAVTGTANIPNFGFFKFEVKRPDETIWLTIQAGNAPVTAGKLGDWDTSRLTPGDYQLALVIVDNQGQASAPCAIQVRVGLAPQATSGP
ncbi:MAG: hypothetical protein JXB15_01170 [Anaerolineales bacterium]|nr:hypothetical protein [Anaerolineales bacterium]